MTELIYLDDAYAKEFDAAVVKAEGRFIVLDKTLFYPESGGQATDTGKLICDGIEYAVVFAKKIGPDVSLEVDKKGLKEKDSVHGVLDWDRRYRLMRMHTACHVLAGVLHKDAGAMITGNSLTPDTARIDFSLENFDQEKLKEYVDKANAIIAEDHDNKAYYVDKNEDVDKFLRLAKGLPPNLTRIRIVEIVGFDIQPDGGTHVHSTKEVGRIRFLKAGNKGKNNRRIYFELEDQTQ